MPAAFCKTDAFASRFNDDGVTAFYHGLLAGLTERAIGGNEEAARLMGLPVDRMKFWTYVQSGVFASLAGVILAAQFGAGQPAEGVGWELFSIAAVVVGGTLSADARVVDGCTAGGID